MALVRSQLNRIQVVVMQMKSGMLIISAIVTAFVCNGCGKGNMNKECSKYSQAEGRRIDPEQFLELRQGMKYQEVERRVANYVCGEREISGPPHIRVVFFCPEPGNLQDVLPLIGDQMTRVLGKNEPNERFEFFAGAAGKSRTVPLIFIDDLYVGSGWDFYYQSIRKNTEYRKEQAIVPQIKGIRTIPMACAPDILAKAREPDSILKSTKTVKLLECWDNLTVGMTAEEVKKSLGEPTNVLTQPENLIFKYDNCGEPGVNGAVFSENCNVLVFLDKAKIVEKIVLHCQGIEYIKESILVPQIKGIRTIPMARAPHILANWKKIKLEMSTEEVKNILGEPDSIADTGFKADKKPDPFSYDYRLEKKFMNNLPIGPDRVQVNFNAAGKVKIIALYNKNTSVVIKEPEQSR